MKFGAPAYYAICILLMVMGVVFILLGIIAPNLSNIFLLISGSLLGTGIAGILSVKMSSESEVEFKQLIRGSFDVYFNKTESREALDSKIVSDYFVYYLTETPGDDGDHPIWKSSRLSISTPIGETVATGLWKIPKPNGEIAEYSVEVVGLKGKVTLFCQSRDTVENTSVFILNRSQIDGDRLFGVHHAISWTLRERISPAIFSKGPIADLTEVSDVRELGKAQELASLFIKRSFILNQMSEPENYLQ